MSSRTPPRTVAPAIAGRLARTILSLLPIWARVVLAAHFRALTVFSDVPSLIRYCRLWWSRSAHVSLVLLRPRALNGHTLVVRSGTTDRDTVITTFSHRFHLPEPEHISSAPSVIWDLGANIGTTMSHMAALYPTARIIGVELDAANAELCQRNVAGWSERCELVRAAVWSNDEGVAYTTDATNEDAYHILSNDGSGSHTRTASTAETVASLSLQTLLKRTPGGRVDYVKMDIEGAERTVLRENTGWADAVNAIKVEVHPPYTVNECVADLAALGFRPTIDAHHPAAVSAVRWTSLVR